MPSCSARRDEFGAEKVELFELKAACLLLPAPNNPDCTGMTSLLHQLQGALADPAIPWKSVLLASIGAKEVFETYVG